ncbi:2'-5' RNA ligase family protein [Notoacmeibacter marinus]|uniref:2'-5' RNA ligase family protein n=1 Tax=Notoacmeibacter marinus TaxID=1876515 RepID=UPI000DF3ADAF|nr:2'-5' RNA ligase family protein [Notoacmeibacter marinus]
MAVDDAPLIVTLGFDAVAFAHFDAMRRRYFPAERNHIPAHLTLFHHLPAAEEPAVRAALAEEANRMREPSMAVVGLFFMGFGSAYRIESPELGDLRSRLSERFEPWLSQQDRRPFRPHVTIQNKAPAAKAKALFSELQAAFVPFEATGVELLLWRYRGGPWDAAGRYPFSGGSER